tara:strand:+ start:1165 stop:2016 length:852 start_codon:yes stop_codon:yes gene_type:complete
MIAWKKSLPGFEWLVHQVWYLEVGSQEEIDPKPNLIPNPRAHLLLTPSEQAYCYDNGSKALSGWGSHLLTANEHLLLLEDSPPIKRIGITFRPEGVYAIQHALNIEAESSGINQCAWFEWLTPWFGDAFQQVLWQQGSQESLLRYIQNYFDSLELEQCRTKPFLTSQKAISIIDKHAVSCPDVAMDIEDIARLCACSRRTLERSFKHIVGLSVKRYQQMARLEQMILALYKQEGSIDWANFSQQFGFTDQSHLIRTLKQQLRKTPNKYLQKRDLTIDVYGDFE